MENTTYYPTGSQHTDLNRLLAMHPCDVHAALEKEVLALTFEEVFYHFDERGRMLAFAVQRLNPTVEQILQLPAKELKVAIYHQEFDINVKQLYMFQDEEDRLSLIEQHPIEFTFEQIQKASEDERLTILEFQNITLTNEEYRQLTAEEQKVYRGAHRKISYEQKLAEVTAFAEKNNLTIKDGYLYAWRQHNEKGQGPAAEYNITYVPGHYYRNWHLDMRADEYLSYGFAIYSKGNTPVRVKIEDWGVTREYSKDTCRVWGFEVLPQQ